MLNQKLIRHSVQRLATRYGNRIADFLTGVRAGNILNPQPWLSRLEQPARALAQTAKALKAEAIDPQTGLVDYTRVTNGDAYAQLLEITRSLPFYSLSDLSDRDTRIAFWVNLYNTLLLDAVTHYRIQGSLLRRLWIFRRAAYDIGGLRYSADDIEHGVLRGNRPHPMYGLRAFASDDPRLAYSIDPPDARIHFALVCGAKSCPPISFYDAAHLDDQLDTAASNFINGGGARYERGENILWLSRIFQWYQVDFGGKEGILALINRYLDAQVKRWDAAVAIRYLPYDWSVNALA